MIDSNGEINCELIQTAYGYLRLPVFFRFGWLRGPRSPVVPEVLAAVADPLTTSLFPVRALTRLAKAFIAGSRSRIAAKKGVATKIEE